MQALHLVSSWPVEHVAAAAVGAGALHTIGDPDRVYRLASLSKPITAWAALVAVEEGALSLDAPLRTTDLAPGATLRHLLAHAAGFGFDGHQPVAGVGRRRIYSNAGFEHVAAEVEAATEFAFAEYLAEAVFAPLGMSTATLRGSAAAGVRGSLDDVARFVAEMLRPRLIAPSTYADATSPQYPELSGIVPGVGRFDPCPWGLGVELHGAKSPHWMGATNSPASFGHFGGSGTMLWVDPVADVGLVALTDRPFDDWGTEALTLWPQLSDAVLAEHRRGR